MEIEWKITVMTRELHTFLCVPYLKTQDQKPKSETIWTEIRYSVFSQKTISTLNAATKLIVKR